MIESPEVDRRQEWFTQATPDRDAFDRGVLHACAQIEREAELRGTLGGSGYIEAMRRLYPDGFEQARQAILAGEPLIDTIAAAMIGDHQ